MIVNKKGNDGEMEQKDYGLTINQIKFCENYLLCGNGSTAYLEAYNTPTKKIKKSTSYTSSSNLLKKENIQQYLMDRKQDLMKSTSLTAEEIIADLVELATDASVKTSDRLKAYDMLGRNLAMFTDKLENNSTMEIEINLDGEELK